MLYEITLAQKHNHGIAFCHSAIKKTS